MKEINKGITDGNYIKELEKTLILIPDNSNLD